MAATLEDLMGHLVMVLEELRRIDLAQWEVKTMLLQSLPVK